MARRIARPEWRGVPGTLLAVLVTSLGPREGGAQCRVHRDERSVGHLHGLLLDSISVETGRPGPRRGFGGLAQRLHMPTTPATVRRLFNQRSGSVLDSLRLAESLRTLARSRILADVALDARECPAAGRATLTVRTTDAWSGRCGVRLGRARAAASIGEDNLFGTGRSLRTSLRLDAGHFGIGVQYVDPWLASTPFALSVSRNQYRGGDETGIRLATAPGSVLDRWRGDVTLSRTSRRSLVFADDRIARFDLRAMLERRAWLARDAAVGVDLGVEHSSATIETAPTLSLVGPAHVRRDFSGLVIGVTRRSFVFVSRPLLAGASGQAELPAALEGDVALSIGRDAATRRPMQRVDAWLGRIWAPGRRSVVSANGWWSGYRDVDGWSAGSTRASLLTVVPTPHGRWTARAASEAMLDPDPDVRSLITFDPTARQLPMRGLAEVAGMMSIERDQRFRRITRGYELGGALFVAASKRWDLAGDGGDRPRSSTLFGAGLRLSPTRIGRATLNLDVAIPGGGSAVLRRPIFTFSISPWFEQERHRDGRPPP